MAAEEDLWAHSMEDAEFQQYLAEAVATEQQIQPEAASVNEGKGRAPGSGADMRETREAKAEGWGLGVLD